MDKTIFRKIGIYASDWKNFEKESYILLEKDGIQECGILCAIKEHCGGFIYDEKLGSCSLPSIKEETFLVKLFILIIIKCKRLKLIKCVLDICELGINVSMDKYIFQ